MHQVRRWSCSPLCVTSTPEDQGLVKLSAQIPHILFFIAVLGPNSVFEALGRVSNTSNQGGARRGSIYVSDWLDNVLCCEVGRYLEMNRVVLAVWAPSLRKPRYDFVRDACSLRFNPNAWQARMSWFVASSI